MKARRVVTLLLLGLMVLAGCRLFRHRERPPFRRISPPVAFEVLRDSPDVLVLDLRSRKEYLSDTGHIFRARNIPLERLSERLLEIAPFRDDTFLVYCRSNDTCGEEGMAILLSSGFDNAILIDGGIDGWIHDGFRTVLPEDAAGQAEAGAAGSGLPPPP
ncbi:MAG TPA: rhodanese-like domain-containing protein [Thermoanaerobaculia bacterium]|jgi:rhodanese-related sulfurtransferase|nr:rhodanese-like domain-containing protein [Thermoanaerobaculia bacterium]